MPEPTEFERKCAQEVMGTPWPDLSGIKAVSRAAPVVVVEERVCVRCARPVEGDRCPACRAHQSTYGGAQ